MIFFFYYYISCFSFIFSFFLFISFLSNTLLIMKAYAMKTNHPHKKKRYPLALCCYAPGGPCCVLFNLSVALSFLHMYITWAYIHTYIHGFAYCIKLEFLDINYTLLGVVVAYQTVFLSSRNTTTIIFLCCCVCTFLSSFFIIFFYLIVYLIFMLILFCSFFVYFV